MKKIIISILCLITLSTKAQNTFPTTGNVGIGTLAPSATLQIGGGTGNLHNGSIGILLKPNTGDRALMELHSPDGANRLVLESLSGASYLASLDAKPLLFQTEGGNVGIGTNKPSSTLHVKGVLTVESQINSPTRLHISGEELLYILNKKGVIVGKEWGGNGNLDVQGTMHIWEMLHIGGGGGSLHHGNIGMLLKPYTGDRALMELHSPDGSNRLILQVVAAGAQLASLDAKPLLFQTEGGNVGIGTGSATHRLTVNGAIRTKEILVDAGWSDFVFDDNYKLRSLTEVEQFVKTNKHLPEIPSQQQVEKNGVPLGDISSKLLMKIEELTLYMIEMKKENETMKRKVADQNRYLKQQTQKINNLENIIKKINL